MGTPVDQELFFGLTPDRVLAAVEAAGMACRPVCYPLNSFENRVYEVELADRSRVVAKFYRPGRWTAEQILTEHRFLAELAAEEMPVCPMRTFPDGRTLAIVDGIPYAVADRRGGRAPDELDGELRRRLGMLIGRLHAVAVRGDGKPRPRIDAERYVRRPLAWLADHGSLPKAYEGRYFAAAEAVAGIAEQTMRGVPVQRLHGDLHLGNVLLRDGQLRLLDFDDMGIGPAVQDLWLAIPGHGSEVAREWEQLLEGYESFRPFDHSTLALVEPLRGLRMVRYAGWLARRWNDPAFRAAWPHFGTDEYWREETEDLEAQLHRIERGEAGGLTPAPTATDSPGDEEALTNRDLFWDWEGD